MKYVVALIAALLVGCSAKPLKLPNQDLAIAVVWNGVYKQTTEPPEILWVFSQNLNCSYGTGFYLRYNMKGPLMDLCASGVFWPDLYVGQVAWEPGTRQFSGTSLAHELLHAVLGHQGHADPDHQDPSWGTQYERPHSTLDDALEALRELGL